MGALKISETAGGTVGAVGYVGAECKERERSYTHRLKYRMEARPTIEVSNGECERTSPE